MNLLNATLSRTDTLRILLYGPSGTGKTHFVGTFPTPMYYFDFDHKFKPLYGRDVELDSYDTSQAKASDEFARLRNTITKVARDPKWKTIVLDSMSTLDPMLSQFVIKRSPRIDKVTGKPVENLDLQLYGHHKDVWTWLTMDLNAIRTANVVMIGHDQYKEKKEGSMTPSRTCPLITGDKIQGAMPGMWEETYYYAWDFANGKKVRRLTYKANPSLIASSAVLNGPGYIDDPTYDTLIAEMQKCMESRKQQQQQQAATAPK